MTSKIKTAIALALLAGPMALQAAPITVDFSLTSTADSTGSYAAGVVGSGFFTFDSSLAPASGSGLAGNPIVGLATLDLSFSWFGTSFDETNAKIATLTFLNGALTDWSIGGNYAAPICGFQRYSCVHSAGTQADFYVYGGGTGVAFNDGVHAGIGAATGAKNVQWSVRGPTAVPEPATLGLCGLGLAGIGLVRRKKKAA